jgi:Lrp/AsnC family transcriptional regulator
MNKLDRIDRQILALIQADASLPIQQVADQVGLGLTVYVRVKTREHSADWARTLNKVIAAMPEILECHRIGGDVDYLLKVVVEDMAGYDRTYKELIERLPSLADVSALFSMERLKSVTGLPIPAES